MIKRHYLIALVFVFVIGLMPASAQDVVNPCDAIEYTGEVQVTPGMTQDEMTTLILENGIKRNYVLEDYDVARSSVELALGMTDDEWALAYFYRACIHLQQDNTSSATNDFETFLEMTDDPELAEDVALFIGSDMTVTSNEEESTTVAFVDAEATFPETLEDYDGSRQSLMAELSEGTGLDFGGQIVVNEARSSIATQGGNDFIEFAPLAEVENFVMGGRINFTPLDGRNDVHACGLLSRTQREIRTGYFNSVSISGFLFLGFDSGGEGILLQRPGGRFSGPISTGIGRNYEYDDSLNILLIVLNNRATVYVEGELRVENFEMSPMFGGGFALTSFTDTTGVECGVQELFVYELVSDFPTTACIAVPNGNVNKRSGPSTNFAQAGLLYGDNPLTIIGQSDDASGFTWWQLSDDSWVREDVAPTVGACGDVPEVSS